MNGPGSAWSRAAVSLACGVGLALAACEALINADFDAKHARRSNEAESAAGGAAGASDGAEPPVVAGRQGLEEPEPAANANAGAAGGAAPDAASPLSGVRRLDARGSDSAVVSRRPGLLDLFVVSDGRIAFHRYDGQGWSAPEYLGGPQADAPTSPIATVAAAFNPDRIEVFAIGEDGSIYHWYSSAGADAVEWFGPEYLAVAGPARPSGGIAATSWQPARLDAFWIRPSGNLGHLWIQDGNGAVESGDDDSIFYLRPLEPVAWASRIKVVSSAIGRLDIFMLAASGRSLLHHWHITDGSFWGSPQRPHSEQLVIGHWNDGAGVLDGLAAANVRQGLDLFLRFRGARHELRRLRYRDGAWATPAIGEPMPQLEALGLSSVPTIFDALSWSPPALDLFGADADGRLLDVWLDEYQSP